MESTLLIKRREAIILAAIDAIDECGVQAVSTKDIAKRQGVSERIIFKHFPTKNDLLNAVLDHYAKYDDAIIQTTESKEMGPLEAITYFFDSYSAYYENYPAITALTQSYDSLQHNTELGSKVKSIFTKRERFVRGQIEKAQEMRLIGAGVDSESIADIMLGTFMRLCLKWRMDGYGFSLRQKTLAVTQIILDSLK